MILMDFQVQLEKAISIIKDSFNPITIYLFGSAAKNELREDSDIDIGFFTEYYVEVDEYEKFMKAQELADIFKRDVDLIHLNSSSTVFKVQVTYYGKVIYCTDNNKREFFEMRCLKDYAILNEERKVIIDKIIESGTVYERK